MKSRRLYTGMMSMALVMLHCHAPAQNLTGTYTLHTPQGPIKLNLEQADTQVTGTLVGYDGTTYQLEGLLEDGEVDGMLTGTEGQAEFGIYRDEEDGLLYFDLIPVDAAGTVAGPGVVYAMQRTAESVESVAGAQDTSSPQEAPAAPNEAGLERDARLVGTWAYRKSRTSDTFGMTIERLTQFSADGTFLQGSGRMMASGGGVSGDTGYGDEIEQGMWATKDDVLYVKMDGTAWVPLARYYIEPGRLLMDFHDGDRQLWYQQ